MVNHLKKAVKAGTVNNKKPNIKMKNTILIIGAMLLTVTTMAQKITPQEINVTSKTKYTSAGAAVGVGIKAGYADTFGTVTFYSKQGGTLNISAPSVSGTKTVTFGNSSGAVATTADITSALPVAVYVGTVTPTNNQSAAVGSLYISRYDTTIWIKMVGTDSAGWFSVRQK